MSNDAEQTAFPGMTERGLTKREYIATQIAAGLAGTGPGWPTHHGDDRCIAEMAVKFADALLAELAK